MKSNGAVSILLERLKLLLNLSCPCPAADRGYEKRVFSCVKITKQAFYLLYTREPRAPFVEHTRR